MNAASGSAGSDDGSGRDNRTRTAQFAASHLSAGDTVGDRYRIESLLGVGGMGMVYLAHDLQLDIPVALKFLRPELASRADSLERFRQELLISRQISSPQVVRIHDLVKCDPHWLISMDYVAGQGLDRHIDQHGPIPWNEAVSITRQIAEGLAAAHARGVIHRDLKPGNILIDDHGQARITDFGVARSLGTTGLTHTGSIIGTPEYISPEQARADQADARSDLYSLGLILHEMLCGTLPWSDSTPTEMLARKMSRQPPSLDRLPADLPRWVRALCARLLQPYPAHRFQSARDVIAAIDHQRVPRSRRRLAGTAVALTVVVLVLAAAAGYGWMHRQSSAPPAAAASRADPARIAVLPFVADDGLAASSTVAPVLQAFDLHLDTWLRGAPGLGPVAPERVRGAMAESNIAPRTRPADAQALRKELAVHELVVPRLSRNGNGYRATVYLYSADRPTAQWHADADSLAQLAQAYRQPVQSLLTTLDIAIPPPLLPVQTDMLAALGSPPGNANVERLQQAHAEHPDSSWLALQLARALHAHGKQAQAVEVIASTRERHAANDRRQDLELAAYLATLRGNNDALLDTRTRIARSFPHDPQAQLELASIESDTGHLDSAVKRLDTLSQQDAGDPRVWFLRGKCAILKGDAQRAVDDYLVRALVQFNRSRDKQGQAEAINALGVGYGRLGQIDAARTEYTKALALRHDLGDARGEATSQRNLAALDWVQGHFESAELRLHKAQMLLEGLSDQQGLADLHNDLGLLAEERGDYDRSLKEFRQGLALRQQLNDARGSAESLNNIGFSYYQQGQYDNALVYWQQAAAAFARVDDQTGIVRSAQSLALLDISRGNWDAAAQRLDKTLTKARKMQMREEQAVSLSYLAKLDILRGNLIEAGQRLDAADSIFEELEDKRGLAEIALQRARLAIDLMQYDQARSVLAGLARQSDDLSIEQRSALELERVRITHLQGHDQHALLRKLDAAIGKTGLHALKVEVALEAAAGAPESLQTLVASLDGNTPLGLRLRGEEYLLEAQARAHDRSAAATYARVRGMLSEHGAYVRAWRLHALGARVLAAQGDSTGAAQAREHARQAMDRLLQHAPAAAQEGLKAAYTDMLPAAGKPS